MKAIKLNIDYSTKPQNLAGELKKKNLQKGDLLAVKSILNEEMVLLIVLTALAFLNQKKMDYAHKLLKDIFGDKNSREIQTEIANEYGIVLEIEEGTESTGSNSVNKSWPKHMEKMSRSMMKAW